jgi:hypothetical protein
VTFHEKIIGRLPDSVLIIKYANLLIRFLLEICALGALGYWGFRVGDGATAKIGLGIGAPMLAAVVWGIFVAPKAALPVPGWLHLLLEFSVLGSAAVALYAVGRTSLAVVFMLIVVINRILMVVWEQ